MSKCYLKLSFGLVASAAFFVSGGAFAQCDSDSAGTFTDTAYDSGADGSSTGGVDDNGGWNQLDPNGDYMYMELGDHAPGDSFRVKGIVGTYDGNGSGSGDTSRDLDWLRMSVSEPCYVTVVLSMSDNMGVPLNGVDLYSLLYIEQGSDPDTATDLYGSYGLDGCPQYALYEFANGVQQSQFPVGVGDILFIVSTPFDGAFGSEPLAYHGEMSYGLDVTISGYTNAACANAAGLTLADCITATSVGGCSDGVCCDAVCSISPGCCDSGWDQSCVDEGVITCGNFIWKGCIAPQIENDCLTSAQLVFGFPANVAFNCTSANVDGPNDSARLCGSSMNHDVWFICGPTPTTGEVLIDMCAESLGNGIANDAVISLFELGTSSEIGEPQDLPSKYYGCVDDSCDIDGDGTIDQGGAAGGYVNAAEGTYWLIRVGSYYNPETENWDEPGFIGNLGLTFRAVFVNHGLQKYCVNAGTNSNVGLVSGWSTSANTKRWSMIPFEMLSSGSVDGFDFAAFDSTTPDVIGWKIVTRDTNGGAYGQNGRPFGSTGDFDQGQVVAEGQEPTDFLSFADVGDSIGERHFIDIATPVTIEAGSYYFTCYGEYADGSTGAAFAWAMYGADGPVQKTTAQVVIDTANSAGASSIGTWPAGTPHGWRGIGTGPKMCFYSLGVDYSTQTGDEPGLLYNCAFNLKGQLASACFGDLDGSGEVDSGDVALALLDSGLCPGCPGDLDGSGEIDSGDVALILLSSGACQ